MRAALARLRHEIAADRQAMQARADEAREVLARWDRKGTPDRPHLLVVAVAVHAWYTGLEAALTSLLGFRDFFRHAYGVDLDTDKLRLEAERLLRVARPRWSRRSTASTSS